MAFIEGLGSFLFIAGAGIAAIGLLWLAAGEYQAGLISAPVMAMGVFAILAGFEALMPLPGAFQVLSHTRQAAVRLKEVVEQDPIEFVEKEETFPIKGHIRFEALSFSYSTDSNPSTPVINNLCLDVAAGNHIALLGKTGCGKSTLIRLLNRGVEPTDGDVLIDGRLLQSFTEKTLYQAITFVPQRTHVFSATLKDNLLLAAPKANDQQLIDVLEATQLNGLGARQYADGAELLSVWIGQGGITLSGGEQRRLAIARALLKPAPILVNG